MRTDPLDVDLEWFLLNPDRGHSWFSRLLIKPNERKKPKELKNRKEK